MQLPDLHPWEDLLNFKPPPTVERWLADLSRMRVEMPASRSVQRIEEASGDLNLDFYSARVGRSPAAMSDEELLRHVRQNFNDFVDVDIACFVPRDEASKARWMGVDPVGAILDIELKLMLPWLWHGHRSHVTVDIGHVLVGDATPCSWRVSTIGDPDRHPVSGNREFGVYRDEDGSAVFYTRGADRPTRWTDRRLEDLVFERADSLWRTLVGRVVNWVNHLGGAAEVGPTAALRLKWSAVEDRYFHTDRARVAEPGFRGHRRIPDALASLALISAELAHVGGVAISHSSRRHPRHEGHEGTTGSI